MEENAEAHMDTDVSSTTDDVVGVQEVSGSHRGVETVIVVEKIEEENMSPNKSKNTEKTKPADHNTGNNIAKPVEKSPQKDPPIKKIIIKTSHKDFQLVKIVQKSPTKLDETHSQMVVVKDTSSNKPSQSSISQSSEDLVDSSSKVEKSPNKDIAKSQKSPSKDKEIVKNIDKSPTKDVQLEESKIQAKDAIDKVSPVKEMPDKPNEDITINVNLPSVSCQQSNAPAAKEQSTKTTPVKEQYSKSTPVKELPPAVVSKDLPAPEKSVSESANGKLDEPLNKAIISVMESDKEASNDSQMETNSDTSEKEHNKSISRELKSLINSAKESKIISECTQLTSKTRKSRVPLDNSNTSLNVSNTEADKIQGVRRSSDNSQKSGSSEKSDKGLKRSMRSQNPEFVNKVKLFLNSVTGKKPENEISDEEVEESKVKVPVIEPTFSTPKKKKTEEVSEKSAKLRTDAYCWRCHYVVEPAANEKVHPSMHCTVCPRSFHYKCLTGPERTKIQTEKTWVCPECLLILQAEGSDSRSLAMKKISLGMLCDLLKHALERMMDINGVEPFMQPVDRTAFPAYDKYVVHPMDLSLMKTNIAEGQYGSTEAFLADAQWILHNSIIFNTLQSKLTGGARALVRSCRAEMGEIEACPECYAAAHARRPTWFTDVCTTPHILLWAKLKGFPYWPAKGMTVSSAGMVDVRFFGAHDRAWVPARDCFLFSEKDPNNFRTKRQDILDSMQEAEQHIRNISRKYGKFVYPPFKTQFDPTKLNEQLKLMIPSFDGEVRTHMKDKSSNASPGTVKDKSRSNSKSSKSSLNDGDTSEGEEVSIAPRKMADGAEIAKEEEDFAVEKERDNIIEVDKPQSTENENPRKRRRSCLEEAVFTIIDSSSKEKRKRDSLDKPPEETKTVEPTTAENVSKAAEPVKEIIKPVEASPKTKDNIPSSSSTVTNEKKVARHSPFRLRIAVNKVLKPGKVITKAVIIKDNKEKTKPKQKLDKSITSDKGDTLEERKSVKRRNSKNKSLNISNAGKTDEEPAKKNDNATINKEQSSKENNATKTPDKSIPSSSKSDSPKTSKERLQFDDDTSLAVIARESAKTNISNSNATGLPTISSVRSLSVPNATATTNKTTSTPKTTEVPIEAPSNSSIFTPTSTENVRNMKEAVNKLQKLRGATETPPVGRVGVRAFARMTSPPAAEIRPNNDVEVEIKAEPMDFDDADRQIEKIDLMNAFNLRPVNPPTNLRDVRINKVVAVTPNNRKVAPKPPEVRPRAKKTFPQPKKVDDGRSELNSKNSMVYIPIQPPMTQAPIRLQRPLAINGPTLTPPVPRLAAPVISSASNNVVNTVTPPLVPVSLTSLTAPTATTATTTGNTTSPAQSLPSVGQVPTTVHTVPLITSVNGQWTLSLQPMMSVGGVDGTPSPPMLNGLPERNPSQISSTPQTTVSTALVSGPPALVPPISLTTQTSTRTTDTNAPGELPRLQQRPSLMNPLDSSTPVGSVPPPSTAGPLTAKLNQNAVKMTDFFRTLLEDSLEKLDEPATQVTTLKLQLEQVRWRNQQLFDEVKHNHELTIAEMRSSFEKEKFRLVSEARRAAQVELEAAVKLAKSKQWCANCSQEAQFYCCWNTSYCDYPCQRAHWAQHYAVCTQQRPQDSNSNDSNTNPPERLQPQPENLPKTAAPTLTVGGKLAPSRVYTQEQHVSPKPAIIMSMMEDTSGNQTLKCVGTYKPPGASQIAPLIINKQIMNNEEAAKKVVTSGGYLIVGASNSNVSTTSSGTLVTPPARRTHTIQYFT